MNINITIEGTTPLICNRFTEAAAIKATNNTSSALTGTQGTPREQCEPKLYRSMDGKTLVIPTANLFRSIIDGGKFFKNGKSKVTTLKNSLIPAVASIAELELPIQHKENWEVDERPIVNPATGGRRLCYRPRFNDWKLEFTVWLDEEMMPVDLFREILDRSGKCIGLGDFRPDRKGPFGKFVVTSWEIIEQTKRQAA